MLQAHGSNRKSFEKDILRGYLENISFIFKDLAKKSDFLAIYPLAIGKYPIILLIVQARRAYASRGKDLNVTSCDFDVTFLLASV